MNFNKFSYLKNILKMSNQNDLQEERIKLMKEILDLYNPNNEGFEKSKDIAKILRAIGRTLENDDEQNFVLACRSR